MAKGRKKQRSTGNRGAAPTPFDWTADLTAEQGAALAQLTTQVESHEHVSQYPNCYSTPSLLRYLKARDWDVAAAGSMVRATVDWRREEQPEKLDVSSDPALQSLSQLGSLYLNGRDKGGRPVVVVSPGGVNPHPPEERVRYLICVLEQAVAQLKEDEGIVQLTWIIDWSDYGNRGRSAGGLAVARNSLHVLQNHYPERLFQMFMINVPWYFSWLFTMLSPLMSASTRSKINWVSGSTEDIKRELVKHIDEDQLDAHFGGSLPTPTMAKKPTDGGA